MPDNEIFETIEFGHDFVAKGYSSCWGDVPDPTKHTTYNARTFLQPQLQKAARSTEKASKGDKNPKDFILFPRAAYSVVATTKDNTGRRQYTEGMVFPRCNSRPTTASSPPPSARCPRSGCPLSESRGCSFLGNISTVRVISPPKAPSW